MFQIIGLFGFGSPAKLMIWMTHEQVLLACAMKRMELTWILYHLFNHLWGPKGAADRRQISGPCPGS